MLRVFLVEDESIIRETLRDTVPWGQCGYSFAGEAGDGEMALPRLIRQAKPDVLITDIRMPFMDGLALSKLVLKEFPQMKIIIISGYDDFEYARQAIDIGVEQYLLKPITKNSLIQVLGTVREKIEGERGNYLAQFRQESQEYEQYTRRRFFEQIAAGQLSVQQIYETAAALDLDLQAQSYAVLFFSVPSEQPAFDQTDANLREELLEHFLKYPEYILLRWNLTTYAALIMGAAAQIDALIRRSVETLRERYETCVPDQDWYVAASRPAQRLSTLPACFSEVSQLWACRYILPRQHILTADTVRFFDQADNDSGLDQLDVKKLDPAVLTGVMHSASVQEIPSFVENYIHSLEEAVASGPFCQFLMLSVRFTATAFVESLNLRRAELLDGLDCLDMVGQNVTAGDLKTYLTEVLLRAASLRDSASSGQLRSLLRQAVAYINTHFAEEGLSLNQVAREINISANYLSAVFSQEMGCTFIEYVTGKRIDRAKELLRTTDKRSSEVAFAVGYRDPHYFSFVFKKTQGITPRDYRMEKGK